MSVSETEAYVVHKCSRKSVRILYYEGYIIQEEITYTESTGWNLSPGYYQ